jgi:CheY-like chemotaxis protein
VSRHRILSVVALALALPLLASGQAESDFYATPKTVPEFWRAARFEIRTGNYERAAERIKGLLDLNPDNKMLFDLVDKPPPGAEPGMGQFLRLRLVPRWHQKDAEDKAAKQRVEELISKVSKAVEAELGNPERIRRYANALAGLPEESAFALKELRRSGKAVPGVVAPMLTEELTEDVRAGVLNAIPQLGQDTVPGFLAILPAAPGTVQADLIEALRARDDFRSLTLSAETDPVPTLWYLWGKAATPEAVKKKARDAIAAATLRDPTTERDPELRTAHGQLTAYAHKFYAGTDNLPKLVGDSAYNVWIWDGKALKEEAMTRAEAAEFYGLRYAKWALELKPDYAPAQKVFLGLAIEHHSLRGGGGRPLAKTAPELHAALATAPFSLLAELLEESIRDKKSAVVLAVVRVLAERNEARAGHSGGKAGEKAAASTRPSLLVRALDYPDPHVQFAAADALLRIPGAPTHGRNSQIVKILAAAVAADPPPDAAKQKVLLTDPDPVRADGFAAMLQRMGYNVEVIRTGRQLVKRVQEKADADLLIVDHHVVDPMLVDLLPQIKADRRARTLPLMVVASPDGVMPVNLFTALARLAAAMAFTDLRDNPVVKFPTANDKKKDLLEEAEQTYEEMRRIVFGRHAAQIQRMQEIVEKAGFTLSDEVRDRIEYLSIQTFPHAILDAYTPNLLAQERILVRRLLPPLVLAEAGDNPTSALKGRIRGDDLPSRETADKIVKLMRLTNEVEGALHPDRLPDFQKLWDSFWNPDEPKLPLSPAVRLPELEAKLIRVTGQYKGVKVVPAVLSEAGFRESLAQATGATLPAISPAEKKENAKTALVWLRKIAVGELPHYKVTDAETAIRGAIASDELAPIAIEALVRIPSREVQRDLANLAVASERPVPIRTQAAGALVEHIQSFGVFVTPQQADAIVQAAAATEDADLRSRLLAAQGILKSDAKGTGERLKGYLPKSVAGPGEAPMPKEKEEPKEK